MLFVAIPGPFYSKKWLLSLRKLYLSEVSSHGCLATTGTVMTELVDGVKPCKAISLFFSPSPFLSLHLFLSVSLSLYLEVETLLTRSVDVMATMSSHCLPNAMSSRAQGNQWI